MPRKKYSEQVINAARLARRTPAQQYAISQRVKQERAYGEAERLRRQRRGARKPTTPTPLTPQQIRSRKAAALREGIMGKLPETPFGRLTEEMKKTQRSRKRRRR